MQKKRKRDFQKEVENKLRNAKSTDPKQYWELSNLRKPKDPNPVVVSEFHISISDNTEIDLQNITDSILELDNVLGDAGIIKVAKSLKNNKSCGADGVFNEYNKTTIDVFLPLYKLLFNHILSTRVIPESWVAESYQSPGWLSHTRVLGG